MQQVIFLGYPDGGLAHMWWHYWDADRPFTSRYTKRSASPYRNSYQPEAPYTAPAVLGDLAEILREFRPTDIYLPHPDDTHPDHWATNAFVTAAAARLRQEDHAFRPEQYNYIIHRGAWQVLPVVPRTEPLLPPADLRGGDTLWYRYILPPETAAIKAKTITEYHSQIKVMRDFLLNFARANELFGTLAAKELPVTEQEFIMDGSPQEWDGFHPVVSDPRGDTLTRRVEQNGDLKTLYLAQGRDHLYLRVDTWGKISKPVTYRIALYVLPNGEKEYHRWVLRVRLGSKPLLKWEERPEGVEEQRLSGAIRENTLEVALPGDFAAPGSKLMVGAESWLGPVVLDKTPWWVVSVDQR